MDESAIAGRLYAGSSPEPKPEAPAPAPTEFEQRAARMYGNAPATADKTLTTAADPATVAPPNPEAMLADPEALTTAIKAALPLEVAELRNTPENRLYGDTPNAAILTEVSAVQGVTPEAAKVLAAEWSRVSRDLGMEDADVKDTIARIGQLKAAPVAHEIAIEETINALNREFGLGAAAALRDAQELVRRDPRVATLLNNTRLGDDAATVVRFARLAQRQRIAGRLKGKT